MSILDTVVTLAPYIIPGSVAIVAVFLGYNYQRDLYDREKRREAYLLGLRTVIRLQYLLAAGEEMNYAYCMVRKQVIEGMQKIFSSNQMGYAKNSSDMDLPRLKGLVNEYHLRVMSAASIVGTTVDTSLASHFKLDEGISEEMERVGVAMTVAFGSKRREIRAEFITCMHAILSSGKFTWFRYDKAQHAAITNLLSCAVFLDKEVERTMDMQVPAPIDWTVVNSLVSDALNATTTELGTVRDIILDLEGISSQLKWPDDVRARHQDSVALREMKKVGASDSKYHFTARIPLEEEGEFQSAT